MLSMLGPVALATIQTSMVLCLRLLIQASTLLLLARLLGPEQFGAFAGIGALAVMLGALSTFGTHLILLGEMSKEPARRVQVLPYAIPTTLVCGIVLLLLYGLACAWLLDLQDISPSVLLLIGSTEILLQPLFLLMASEQHALGRIALSQLLQMLPMLLRMCAVCLLYQLQTSQPLFAYAIGYAVASILALSLGAATLPARWPSWRNWRIPDRSEQKEAIGYAALNITKASPAELDKALALKLLPPEAAGLYAAAARVVSAVVLPVTAMTLSALPRLFRDSNNTTGQHLLVCIYSAALIYSVLLASALWLAAPFFFLLFGVQYEGIHEVIRLLCFAIPGVALRLVAGNALMALGKPWMRVIFEAIGLSILVITSTWLVKSYGVSGLSLSLAFSEWSMAIVGACLVVYSRRSKIEVKI